MKIVGWRGNEQKPARGNRSRLNKCRPFALGASSEGRRDGRCPVCCHSERSEESRPGFASERSRKARLGRPKCAGPRNNEGNVKIAVRSHQVIENEESQFGTKPNQPAGKWRVVPKFREWREKAPIANAKSEIEEGVPPYR
jgi:hypothetical protein